MANQHVLYAEPVKEIDFTREIGFADYPIRFLVRWKVIIADCGNVLCSDHGPARCRLLGKPGQHLFRLCLRLRRQGLGRGSFVFVLVAQQL